MHYVELNYRKLNLDYREMFQAKNEVRNWCRDNCTDRWWLEPTISWSGTILMARISFASEHEAVMFVLHYGSAVSNYHCTASTQNNQLEQEQDN